MARKTANRLERMAKRKDQPMVKLASMVKVKERERAEKRDKAANMEKAQTTAKKASMENLAEQLKKLQKKLPKSNVTWRISEWTNILLSNFMLFI